MHDVEALNSVTTVLTLLANGAVAALCLVGLAAAVGDCGRRQASRIMGWVGPRGCRIAFGVAAVSTAGSLYYSEVIGFTPCALCWEQRICMFPLVPVLAVGVLRRDRKIAWYAAPFAVVGAGIALNQWLLERSSSLPLAAASRSPLPLCDVPYFQKLGYVTLAFMDLSAFLLIASVLAIAILYDRAPRSDQRR